MATIGILAGTVTTLWLLVRLVATIRADGYGLRPGPRSHVEDDLDTRSHHLHGA